MPEMSQTIPRSIKQKEDLNAAKRVSSFSPLSPYFFQIFKALSFKTWKPN
jgi:hypothetical protein